MSTESQVKPMTAREAFEFLKKTPRAIFLDVRSHMEFLFIGHPVGALHVPWIDEPDWTINPGFVKEVRQLVLGGLSHESGGDQDVPVLLICRSGKRSLEAGELLLSEGFHNVYNIADGFEGDLDEAHHRSTRCGWRFEGLPWEQC